MEYLQHECKCRADRYGNRCNRRDGCYFLHYHEHACGTANATKTVTINPSGSAGAITGPDTVCIGSTITLTGAVPGGVWSAGNTNASVGSSSGVVTGVSSGSTSDYLYDYQQRVVRRRPYVPSILLRCLQRV